MNKPAVDRLNHCLNAMATGLAFFLGPIAFGAICVLGVVALVYDWDGFKFGDYLQAVAAGAGLLAVSHGIHRAARAHEARTMMSNTAKPQD